MFYDDYHHTDWSIPTVQEQHVGIKVIRGWNKIKTGANRRTLKFQTKLNYLTYQKWSQKFCSNFVLYRFEVDVALALLPTLVRVTRLILDGPPEEGPAREASHSSIVDVLGRRLEADFAFLSWRDERVRLLFTTRFARLAFRLACGSCSLMIQLDPFYSERIEPGRIWASAR